MTPASKALSRLLVGYGAVVAFLIPNFYLPVFADVSAECLEGVCRVLASADEAPGGDYGPASNTIAPNDPTGESTAALAAAAYEAANRYRCEFVGMPLTDAEADLAPADIVRWCTDPARAEVDLPADVGPSWDEIVAFVSTAFVALEIAPSPISYQPNGDWALVNMDFIVYTDREPQTFDVELLPGLNVTFVATPVHWSWDFGDGSPSLATSSAGQPYPNHDVSHFYDQASEGVTITATTAWQGAFQINGQGPWLPVAGFATTSSSVGPVEIVAMDVVLVPNPEDR